MRWRLRAPRLPRPRLLPLPLALVLVAAVAEVVLHGRQYSVRQPARDLDEPFQTGCAEPPPPSPPSGGSGGGGGGGAPREKAALVMLARNADVDGALRTLESVERHFNRWFHYPVVFLNDEPWDDAVVRALRPAVSGDARFEVVPPDQWSFPPWIDPDDARASIEEQGRRGILYAGKESYHHMCRFFSG